MKILRYTLVRLALIAAFAGVFYLAGMRSYLLAFAAVICGAMAGYIFFGRLGNEAAGQVQSFSNRGEPKPAVDPLADEEDAQVDALRAENEPDEQREAVSEFEEPGIAEHANEREPLLPAQDAPAERDHERNERNHQ